MRARQIIGLLLAIVALPFLVLGLIDPLEGGIALIVGLLLGVAGWLISKVPVPRFTWIALAATIAVGALTLVLALTLPPIEMGPDSAAGPVAGRGFLVGLNWVWRIGVLVTFAGAIWYIVRIVQALLHSTSSALPPSSPASPSSGDSGRISP